MLLFIPNILAMISEKWIVLSYIFHVASEEPVFALIANIHG